MQTAILVLEDKLLGSTHRFETLRKYTVKRIPLDLVQFNHRSLGVLFMWLKHLLLVLPQNMFHSPVLNAA